MAIAESERTAEGLGTYRGLRDWLDQVNQMGELLTVNGAHWDNEMGSLTQMLTESSKGTAPAILFDDVPGYLLDGDAPGAHLRLSARRPIVHPTLDTADEFDGNS